MRLVQAAIVLATLVGAATPASAACLSPGEARRAVDSGEAVRLGAVARNVPGEILSAELCEEGGGLVYRLTIMGPAGRVFTVLVDARSGQILN